MTDHHAPMPRWLAAAVIAVVIMACGSSPTAALADDDGFVTCTSNAGVEVAGLADLDQDGQRELLATPAAVDCLLATQDADQLAAVLGALFPDPETPDVGADPERLAFLRPYAAATDIAASEAQQVASLARLLHAFDEADGLDCCDDRREPAAMHNMLAIIVHQADTGELVGYAAWLDEHGRDRDQESLMDWYVDIGNTGTPPFDQIDTLATQLGQARETSG